MFPPAVSSVGRVILRQRHIPVRLHSQNRAICFNVVHRELQFLERVRTPPDPNAAQRLLDLVRHQFRRPILTRGNACGRSPEPITPSTVSISRPCDVVVSAHWSPNELNPALRSDAEIEAAAPVWSVHLLQPFSILYRIVWHHAPRYRSRRSLKV
jgi:hypothetical protein